LSVITDGYDVWNDVISLQLEGPPVFSDAAKSGLHFVRDANSSGLSNYPTKFNFQSIKAKTTPDKKLFYSKIEFICLN